MITAVEAARVALGAVAIATWTAGSFAAGKIDGANEVRRATVVRVGIPGPTGPYFGICAPIRIPAPGGSAAWLLSAQACAADQPEQSRDLPPGEMLRVGGAR